MTPADKELVTIKLYQIVSKLDAMVLAGAEHARFMDKASMEVRNRLKEIEALLPKESVGDADKDDIGKL